MTKVAVVGAGHWGKNLIRNFHELGDLVVVCDSDTRRHLAFKKSLGDSVAHYLTVDETLRKTSPDTAIVVATPAETHYDVARAALDARRDVFVEKPLALRLEQARELVYLAKRLGRVLMVGHVLEYHPAVVRLTEMVQAGTLGALQYVYSHRLSFGRLRKEENVMWSFAPHDIAVILRLFGEEPHQVSAFGARCYASTVDLPSHPHDATVLAMRFQDAAAHVHVSWLHPFKEQRLVVVGSRAMAVFDDVAKTLVVHRKAVEDGKLVDRDTWQEDYSKEEPLHLECRAFSKCVSERREPLTHGDSALRVLSVLERAQDSMRSQLA